MNDVNTGMKMVDLKGSVVDQLTPMNDTEKDYAEAQILKFLFANTFPKRMMLMRKEDSYFALLERQVTTPNEVFAKEILNFLTTDEYLKTVGELKLVDEAKEHMEVWLGDKFFALFNFDGFVVHI